MTKGSTFSGLAGETVRQFAWFGTLLTAMPAMLAAGVLGFGALFMAQTFGLPPVVWPLLVIVAVSPVLGRFALAAKHGDLMGGLLGGHRERGELLPFVLRFALLSCLWFVPVALLAWWLLGMGVMSAMFGGVGSLGLAMATAAFVIVVGVGLACPSLTLIVAVKADSLADAISRERWRWLLDTRGQDLVPFFGALFGGGVVLFILVWPWLLVAAGIVAAVDTGAGLMLGTTLHFLPFAALPILQGRLAGAFVLADEQRPEGAAILTAVLSDPKAAARVSSDPKLATTLAATVLPTRASPPAGPTGEAFSPVRALKDLQALAEKDLAGAVKEAEALVRQHPSVVGLSAELAKLYARSGKAEEAINTAASSIKKAMSSGANPLAMEIYDTFKAHRKNLRLEATDFEHLAKVLLASARYEDAAWAFLASGRVGGEGLKVEKGLIAVADAAAQKGAVAEASRFYDLFLKTYPKSAFVDYCQTNLGKLQPRR